jgi:hypothetical protein
MSEATRGEIADRLAIRQVLDEYCLCLEVNAFDEWLDLFTEDTVYVVFRRSLHGREEVRAMLSQAPHGVHLPGATRITLTADRAETIQSYLFIPTSDDRWNAGWYQRTLLRTDDGWKISHTQVKIARTGELRGDEKARALPFPVSFTPQAVGA